MKRFQASLQVAVAAACASFLFSCASPTALRAAIDERDAEIRQLQEEKMDLKDRIDELNHERDNLEVALREASVELDERPEPAFPQLDELGVGYGIRDGRVVITLPSTITFASGKAALSDTGRRALEAVASTLMSEYGGAAYHIEGHTDTDPISKSKFDSNRDLSLQRAMAVLTYLVEQCEVPDDRCVVVGHGQYRPVTANDSAEHKARNRRVEIVVHSEGT